MKLRLAIIGFGSVGEEFAKMLLSKQKWLSNVRGLDVEVVAIATRTRGCLLSKKGLDLARILRLSEAHGSLMSYGPELTSLSTLDIIQNCDADIIVELTPLNINTGQPSIDYLRRAFEIGCNVITANKGPIAFAYNELMALARSKNVHFRFEGTIMDGTPVFSLVERTLPGCEIQGIYGVLNSTTNFILSLMERGVPMENALDEARNRHITEVEPTLDIEGWDTATKIAALANVFMNSGITPQTVKRRGIRDVTQESIRQAMNNGKKIKLVATAERTGSVVNAAVGPELVGPESPFWCLNGTSSALTLKTDLMGRITIIENEPTIAQTAYAIFSDMLSIAEQTATSIGN